MDPGSTKRRGSRRATGAVAIAVLCALGGIMLLPFAYDAAFPLIEDDPAAIADHLLDKSFTAAAAREQITAALDVDDIDLANSTVELARDRGLSIGTDLAERVAAANSTVAVAKRHAGNFARGLVTGEPDDAAGLAGTAL